MKLMVGLGNPGTDYAKTRHNIGFMAIDRIADLHHISAFKSRFQSQVAEGRLGSTKLLLIKPQTFMNNSGQAVGEAMRFYKLAPEDVCVVYDEIELTPGKVRVKLGGGSAGHNGIKSIDKHIGNAFWRVRLGVGHPRVKDKVNGHVLSNFSKTDQDWLEPLLDSIAREAELLLTGGENLFMTRVAQDAPPPDAPKEAN